MLDPIITAERILHGIDPGPLSTKDRLRLARALLEHGRAEDHRTRLLLHALVLLSDENDRDILRAVIRRRLRVLPPPPGVVDGLQANGGE